MPDACARKSALAKHYVLQALELDYSASARLQADVQCLPFSEIRPPRVLANVDTFRPIIGLGNRDHDLALVRWILPHFRMALRRKKQDLDYYSTILKQPEEPIPRPTYPRCAGGLRAEYNFVGSATSELSSDEESRVQDPPASRVKTPNTFFTPSIPPGSSSSHPTPLLFDDTMPHNPLDVNLHSSPAEESRSKHFDLALHVQVLRRDVAAMKELDDRIGSLITRLCNRIKEALGRRVWAGKPIYPRDANKRVVVSREDWMEKVNFGGARSKPSSVLSPSAVDDKPIS